MGYRRRGADPVRGRGDRDGPAWISAAIQQPDSADRGRAGRRGGIARADCGTAGLSLSEPSGSYGYGAETYDWLWHRRVFCPDVVVLAWLPLTSVRCTADPYGCTPRGVRLIRTDAGQPYASEGSPGRDGESADHLPGWSGDLAGSEWPSHSGISAIPERIAHRDIRLGHSTSITSLSMASMYPRRAMFLISNSLTSWLPSPSRRRLMRVAPAASSQSLSIRPEMIASIWAPDSNSSSRRASARIAMVSIIASVSLNPIVFR